MDSPKICDDSSGINDMSAEVQFTKTQEVVVQDRRF